MAKLDNYFVLMVNMMHERANFYQRTQKPREMIEEYIRRMKEE